jgi:hypothetical protein
MLRTFLSFCGTYFSTKTSATALAFAAISSAFHPAYPMRTAVFVEGERCTSAAPTAFSISAASSAGVQALTESSPLTFLIFLPSALGLFLDSRLTGMGRFVVDL